MFAYVIVFVIYVVYNYGIEKQIVHITQTAELITNVQCEHTWEKGIEHNNLLICSKTDIRIRISVLEQCFVDGGYL